MLEAFEILALADIRRFPSSRRHPHFSQSGLDATLAARGILYRHFENLGGYRKPVSCSPNTAIRSPGFRAYADHMRSNQFQSALEDLLSLALTKHTAVMCAEASPQHCHRQFLADALTSRGAQVVHILGLTRSVTHQLHPLAKIENGLLTYPGLF